jgi:adenine phosphoribosyltransferase
VPSPGNATDQPLVPAQATPPDPAEQLHSRLVETFRWIDPGDWCDHYLTDRSGWWRDALILERIGPALAALCTERPTVVVAPATSGFLLGPLVARALGVGFAEAYRDLTDHELADELVTRVSGAGHDGRTTTLAVRARHLSPEDRVLIVDDWVETGAQLGALAEIVAAVGARYLGAAVVVDGAPAHVREHLAVRGLLRDTDLDHRRVR